MDSIGERKRPHAQVNERLYGSVDSDDLVRLLKREQNEDWVFLCQELADADLQYAEEQLVLGNGATARYFFWAAGAMYGLAQYGLTDVTDEKLALYRKMNQCNKQYARLGTPAWQEVSIPYKDYVMDGWLALPKSLEPENPIVISIAGATAFKDQAIHGVDSHLANGRAVLIIDGPGQGTTRFFNNGFLEVELEKAYSKMVDFVKEDGRFGKIAITGGSTGGYYVARAAATDKRIDACIALGGSYAPQEIVNYAQEYRHKFAVLSGVNDEEMDLIFPKMTLQGLAEQIECPLLVVHGQADPIFNVFSAKRIYDEAASKDKTFVSYPGAWHCAAGYGSRAGRLMADWLTERLK
ncbi:alpha/beta hydrolase family protein [Rhizobium sp. P28RR-XV]|uniref:alpha/beta hydrolase family protein n=1 Tax=Rhizobium sp. P28RR-XV TaxID=2726737 RepID=UPI001456E613|nr:alpha/beta hydrolase [Rhizobium sp. P28RR-XV]NLR88400.1 prolyl oligopeptidase family serine peptidase [Rhizobium sp. P28RR-XV]